MKIFMNILFIIMIIMMSMGCGKEPMPSPCKLPDCRDTIKWVFKQPDSLGVLPILWYKVAHAPDTSGSHQWCFATDEGVLLVNQIEDGSNKPYIRLLDRTTGQQLWYWDRMPVEHYTDIQYLPERKMIMVKNYNYDAILDVNTGKEILYAKEPAELRYKSTKGAVIGEYYYTSVYEENDNPKEGQDYARLIRTRLGDGVNWETILTRTEDEVSGYSPYFYNIKPWVHPQSKDTIILINNRMYHWERYHDGYPFNTLQRVDLVAYNLTKDKVEWTIDSICKTSSIRDPFQIVGDKMFFQGDKCFYLDLSDSGKVIWINPTVVFNTEMYDSGNKSLIGFHDKLFSIDQNSGVIKWTTTFEYSIEAVGMELFEGYLYFVYPNGDLYVINATTGKIVFQEFSGRMLPGRSILGMRGRASVDREHRLLYCSDLWGTYCLKLPERWE